MATACCWLIEISCFLFLAQANPSSVLCLFCLFCLSSWKILIKLFDVNKCKQVCQTCVGKEITISQTRLGISSFQKSSCKCMCLHVILQLGVQSKKKRYFLGIFSQNGGGGLNPCQDGLWHLFLEEMTMYKWAFAWLHQTFPPSLPWEISLQYFSNIFQNGSL